MYLGDKLEAFILVVEGKSLASAARQLNISSAAMTKRIQELENALGIQLLIRTTRSIELTEAGRLCYDQARTMKVQWQEMQAFFSEIRNEPVGPLRVGGSRYFFEEYILPYLNDFLDKYPKIEFVFEANEKAVDLEKERLDINLGHSSAILGGPNDIVRRIGSTHYVYVASPQYIKAFGMPKKPEDLKKGHRYIEHLLRYKMEGVLSFDKGLEVILEPFLKVNDTLIMKNMALAGLGIVKLYENIVTHELQDGSLVELIKGYDTKEHTLCICYRPFKHVQAKIRVFIDYFLPKMPV